jgi:hypothetical protein
MSPDSVKQYIGGSGLGLFFDKNNTQSQICVVNFSSPKYKTRARHKPKKIRPYPPLNGRIKHRFLWFQKDVLCTVFLVCICSKDINELEKVDAKKLAAKLIKINEISFLENAFFNSILPKKMADFFRLVCKTLF